MNTIRPRRSQLQTTAATRIDVIQKEGGSVAEHRYVTGTREFDRVLGGGLVMGGVYLLSGEPGQGKTTLAQTVAAELADGVEEGEEAKKDPFTALYISGEETAQQIADRGKRICPDSKSLQIAVETDAEKILRMLEEVSPDLAVIDSVQKLTLRGESNTPNSIRAITNMLVEACKRPAGDVVGSLVIICHVTKDGTVAGPKYLEHMVDSVLVFESENRSGKLRALRALKNRYGDTSYVGLFEMGEDGLKSVDDPSAFLLRGRKGPPGSSVGVPMIATSAGHQASRPMLCEVQALFGPPVERGARWTAIGGYSDKRLAMMMVLLSSVKSVSEGLSEIVTRDVYVNVPSSLKIDDECSLDLPVVMALASAALKKPLPPGSVFWGEIDLLGNIRHETEIRARLAIAERMKFNRPIYSEEKNVLTLEQVVQSVFEEKKGE